MSEETAARLHALLAKARARHRAPEAPVAPAFPAEDPTVVELVRSFLVWEAGESFASRALASIQSSVVDLNELRVFLPDEIVSMLGSEDARAQERAERLRACLNEVYAREHDIRLSHLGEEGKRDVRAYLDTLDGMHPFVAARVSLLCFGAHAFPVDSRLRDALARARVVPAGQSPTDAGSWTERQIRAGEALASYRALEAMVDAQAPRAPKAAKAPKRPAAPRKPAVARSSKEGASRARSPRKPSSEK